MKLNHYVKCDLEKSWRWHTDAELSGEMSGKERSLLPIV